MNDSSNDLKKSVGDEGQAILHHWYGLSGAERMALSSLGHEIEVATDLIEESVENIIGCFLEINRLVAQAKSQQTTEDTNTSLYDSEILTKIERSGDFSEEEKELLKSKLTHDVNARVPDLDAISQLAQQAIQDFQFQDRTKQRLDQVIETLKLMSSLLYEMEKTTIPHLSTAHKTKDERRWIETLIQHMKLGEMRQRFIRNALFEQGFMLFEDLDEETQNSLPNDDNDIELF